MLKKNRSFLSFTLVLFLFFGINTTELKATQLPDGFVELEIANGLDPVAMALAPDGRIFLAEKNGKISIIREGELLPDPFLVLEVDNFNERGLQSIAIHPDFEFNNYIYFFYMSPGDNFNKVTRWTANGDFAIPGSEELLYEMDLVFGPNHNGGGMQFGIDKHLYIATGDGVDGGTPQDMNDTGGKVLRLQGDGTIPMDNPFYESAEGKYKAIWSLGLRNPFTVAVQPNSGRLFFCDVGQSLWEEINEIEKGKNYGWPEVEGFFQSGTPPINYKDPIYAYGHEPDCAIVGATFYNPLNSQFPPIYEGQFFFMDYCSGYIKVMNPNTGTILETFATEIDRPIALLVDNEGAMYYLARAGMGGGSPQDNTSSSNGRLMKIIYTGSGAPFISQQPASILIPQEESATFNITVFGASPLSYQWQQDGVDINGANDVEYTFTDATINDDGRLFRCKVTNGFETVFSEPAILNVTNGNRPEPIILFPTENATYVAGDQISFSGMAFDQEDGDLSVTSFQWKVDFHHLDHIHPAMSPLSGIEAGYFDIPQIGEISDEVWYRIHLTVTDSEGLQQNTYRDIFPEKTTIPLATEPKGLRLIVDGRFESTPINITSVKGIQRSLVAPYSQVKNDSLFLFTHWQNGTTDRLFSFFAADDLEPIKAYYEVRPLSGGSGLMGEYFDYFNEAPHFDQEPKFSRIDPEINFNWVLGSPQEWVVGVDSFLMRWTGSILSLYEEEYTFYLNADDGVRLWIEDDLIIDQWVFQEHPEEWAATKVFEKGKFYKLRLEYFEGKKNAKVILSWESQSQPKQVIPKEQLFPRTILNSGNIETILYPNPATEQMTLQVTSKELIKLKFSIFDTSGKLITEKESMLNSIVSAIPFDLRNIAPGIYFLQVVNNEFQEIILFQKD